jgi:catechol 1,2-dioxygenase
MKRRIFIQKSALTAMSISAFGAIQWNGKTFVGNSPTTTDILGPFYRPGAPMRENIAAPDSIGSPMTLAGTIFKEDGRTALKDALVEVWQCGENALYDNVSDAYFFRGAAKTAGDGKYSFKTVVPVPYKARPDDEASWRPAHIHMRVSIPGLQDLITQIYFKGGKYNSSDKWSSSPAAANRILEIVKNPSGGNAVTFDVVLAGEIPLDPSVYGKITGLYHVGNDSTVEFMRSDDLLFMKRNGQLSSALKYIGNNTFEGGGTGFPKVTFELLPEGRSKAVVTTQTNSYTAEKYLKYSD